MSTIRQIIQRVDENKPNSFSTETKVIWLAQLDGKITADVFLMDVAEVRQFTYDSVTDMDTELLVRFPHDDIYYYWLMAKIDAENGEYDKYQNTMQLYNASYNNFVGWFLGCYEPQQYGHVRRRLPSYYITAYGLAVKRGFEGTIDQWLESLHGKTAYEVAVLAGFEGTVEEWLKSLRGPTPYIGANGNWWIGDEDTGVLANYAGPVIPAGILLGDVNGDGKVDVRDARLITQYLSGEITAGQLRLEVADVNGDGAVDAADAELITAYNGGLAEDTDIGVCLNYTEEDGLYFCDLAVTGLAEDDEVLLVADTDLISKTVSMAGVLRVYLSAIPAADIPVTVAVRKIGVRNVHVLDIGDAEMDVTSLDLSGYSEGDVLVIVQNAEQ